MKQSKKDKYAANWDLLYESGLQYNCFTDYHVRIENKVDWFPGSGKWLLIGTKSESTDFEEMVSFLNQ